MARWNEVKEIILQRIDIRAEYETMGLQFVGNPSQSGWIACHNPFKKDDNPSCGVNISAGPLRGYFVAHNMQDGSRRFARNFFDMASELLPGMCGDFRFVINEFARRLNIEIPDGAKQSEKAAPPTEEYVQKYIDGLTEETKQFLHDHRGLSDETIAKYKIGWALKRERFAFPVYDRNDVLVNIRYHNSKKHPKTLNHRGYGEARLYGVNRLAKAPPGSTVCITEGEFDSALLEQETGLVSTSPTNGCKTFLTDWVEEFHGHHVVIVFDCDKEGRNAVRNLVLPSFKKSVQEGKVLSIKVIWLFDTESKDLKDFTDWIIKAGGTGQGLLDQIAQTSSYIYPTPTMELPDPIEIPSFAHITKPELDGKRVTTSLFVFGENEEQYRAPTEIEVTNCSILGKSCHGRDDWDWVCDEAVPVMAGNRVILSCVGSADSQMMGALRDYVCDKGKKPSVKVLKRDVSLTEVYVHQIIDDMDPAAANALMDKAVYVVGGEFVPIGKYRATGVVMAHPRHQKPTMVIDTLQPESADWQAFDLEQKRPLLEALKKLSPIQIVQDLSKHVTRIYERDDLHLGVLLCLCSPLWIDFPGEGEIRGWISAGVIGDTGTGKSTVSEKIFRYAGVGTKVSGQTSSRTGITYACEFSDRKGWQLKAGALLKMTRQAMIIDEAQSLDPEDIKTMAESIEAGKISIARIQQRTFEAMTRVFFTLNPVSKERRSHLKTMDSFRYGCRALKDIFSEMMIRRIDLFLFAASYDIKDKNRIYMPADQEKGPRWVTPDRFKALVYYAWNLKVEQIRISDEVAMYIKTRALDIAMDYGQCSDLPIVYPEDFRKTFCRLVTAFAVIDLNSYDGFETIVVEKSHVDWMEHMIRGVYSSDNCRLDGYSKSYFDLHGLENPDELAGILKKHLNEAMDGRRERMIYMIYELMKMEPNVTNKISQKVFADQLDVDRTTINRDMAPLIKYRLVNSGRGYSPTTRLIQLVGWIEENMPDMLKED